MLRRVLAQAQIQRVLDEARRHHIIGSTHVSCKAAAILRCASNAGRAHLYYLHKSSSKCNQTSTSRGRTSQSCTTRKPKYYYYSPFSLNLSQTKGIEMPNLELPVVVTEDACCAGCSHRRTLSRGFEDPNGAR